MQFFDEWLAVLAAALQALLGAKAVNLPFDIEQGIDPLTASSAIGEIAAALLPRLAFAAMSASTKNLRRECAQQSAWRRGAGSRSALNSGL